MEKEISKLLGSMPKRYCPECGAECYPDVDFEIVGSDKDGLIQIPIGIYKCSDQFNTYDNYTGCDWVYYEGLTKKKRNEKFKKGRKFKKM